MQYVFQKKRLIDLIHKECLQINKKDEHYNRKIRKRNWPFTNKKYIEVSENVYHHFTLS